MQVDEAMEDYSTTIVANAANQVPVRVMTCHERSSSMIQDLVLNAFSIKQQGQGRPEQGEVDQKGGFLHKDKPPKNATATTPPACKDQQGKACMSLDFYNFIEVAPASFDPTLFLPAAICLNATVM